MAAAKAKAEGRTNGRQISEGAWSLNGRTRRESAGNRGSGQRGNKKAVKIFALWDAVKLFCAAGFCRKQTGEEPYPPLPAIFRIRGFDTGRGLGVNSAGPQDLGGGYLLLLHLILFLYSYSYKV